MHQLAPPTAQPAGGFFTRQQIAARHPAFSVSALRHLQATGKLPAYRVSRRVLVREQDLLDLIESGRTAARQ